MARITKRVVETISPQDKDVLVWDDQLKGFGLRVYPNGTRKYLVKYRANGGGARGQQRWFVLGAHGTLTSDQARRLAQQALAAVARGEDPQGDKKKLRSSTVMHELWTRYEEDHLPQKKASSAADDKGNWVNHISPRLGRKRVADVTADDVEKMHKKLRESPYQANRVLSLLSKIFNLAHRWGLRHGIDNPVKGVDRFPEQKRKRYLKMNELERLGTALRDEVNRGTVTAHSAAAIQLLILTGARVSEILSAKWDWVSWNQGVIELPESKTGAKQLFLSQAAVAVLKTLREMPKSEKNPFIICGRIHGNPLVNLAKPWARVKTRAGLPGVRLHDLRHTAASVGVSTGASLSIIGRLLGHTQASTTHRYAHVDIDPAMAAIERMGQVISGAMAPKSTPSTGGGGEERN